MDMTVQPEFRTKLTGAEFRLITLALDRKLHTRDMAAAEDLNMRLLEARARTLGEALKSSEEVLQQVKERKGEFQRAEEGKDEAGNPTT